MKIGNQADKCLSFIRCDLESEPKRWFPHTKLAPAVTCSRQTGCDARAIAKELAGYLQSREPAGQCCWTVFDKALVEKVLEEHKLPKEVAKYMPEDRISAIQDAVEELLGLHPSSRTLLRQSNETILHLAEHGYGILIGRAGNVITRHLKNVFHVRLVAPIEWRVERIMARNHLDAKAARGFIHKSDLGRQRFLKDHFHADIDDCGQYNLVVNTGQLPDQVVARMIGDAIVHWAGSQ
ncbi:MAG: cytidylate kinase-like family protein [Akkermansiaceae bacterium]|nr:cytidylate kinase-like family protein [Akkermansiaceae bacterium]MCF7731477.1 cytidylate kinase-like family protein [Akkermansiaceae bacterium]